MTVWGGFTNHLRVGADISTDGYNSFTPSINVYITWYVQVDSSWNFADSQTLVMTSPQGDSWTFQNNMGANGIASFGHTIFSQGQSYGGGPTYTFSANLQGVYLGAGPSLSFAWALPARPTRPPSPPGAPVVSNLQSTSCTLAWGDSGDYGGLAPDSTTVHIATDPGMTQIVQDVFVGGNNLSRNITGLTAGTTYYAQSFSHNGSGWSSGSAVTSFKTLSGAKVRINGVWVDAVASVRVNGAWQQAQVFKRINGIWVQ